MADISKKTLQVDPFQADQDGKEWTVPKESNCQISENPLTIRGIKLKKSTNPEGKETKRTAGN